MLLQLTWQFGESGHSTQNLCCPDQASQWIGWAASTAPHRPATRVCRLRELSEERHVLPIEGSKQQRLLGQQQFGFLA